MSNINIEDHINLIHHRLQHKFHIYPGHKTGIYDYEDIVQECMFGLIKASEYYDPSKGSFSNIAIRLIDICFLRCTKKLNKEFSREKTSISLNYFADSEANSNSINPRTIEEAIIPINPTADMESQIVDRETLRYIFELIEKLCNQKTYDIMYLRFVCELSMKEIAELYNTSYTNINKVVYDCRKRLRKYVRIHNIEY